MNIYLKRFEKVLNKIKDSQVAIRDLKMFWLVSHNVHNKDKKISIIDMALKIKHIEHLVDDSDFEAIKLYADMYDNDDSFKLIRGDTMAKSKSKPMKGAGKRTKEPKGKKC